MLRYSLGNFNIKLDMNTLEYPLSVYMKVTTKCMLNCKFCSQKLDKKNEMDFDFAKKQLQELKKLGIVYIYYTGGEPLLYGKINDLIKFGYELGFKQILITNGILLSSYKNLEILKYLIALGISLHGSDKIHDKLTDSRGSYNKIIENLKLIRKSNNEIKININCTAVCENSKYEEIMHLANICEEYRCELTIARLNYVGKGTEYKIEDNDKLIEYIDKANNYNYNIKLSNCVAPCTMKQKYRYLAHGCGAGQSIAAIDYNGDVKICATSEYILGNLSKKTFEKIWKCRELKKFKDMKWLPLRCTSCKDLLNCKGGCKAEMSGKFWERLCDNSVGNRFNIIWEKLKIKTILLNFSNIRKDYDDYLIVSFPSRVCNKDTFNVIKLIDGKRTGQEILDILNGKYDENKVKELLVSMSLDDLIKV